MFPIGIFMELLGAYLSCCNVQPLLVGLHFHLSWQLPWLLVTISPIFCSVPSPAAHCLAWKRKLTTETKKENSQRSISSLPVRVLRGATPTTHFLVITSALFTEIGSLWKHNSTSKLVMVYLFNTYSSEKKVLVERLMILCTPLSYLSYQIQTKLF